MAEKEGIPTDACMSPAVLHKDSGFAVFLDDVICYQDILHKKASDSFLNGPYYKITA